MEKEANRVARVQIEREGEVVTCADAKAYPGVKKDMSLRFCLPSKDEMLKLMNVEQELFEKLRKTSVSFKK